MIQFQTLMNLTDNKWARELICIQITASSNHWYAHIGNIIVTVIKKTMPNMPLKRLEVTRTVIVCTSKELKVKNDMIILYDDNAAFVIDQVGNSKWTRVLGVTVKQLR